MNLAMKILSFTLTRKNQKGQVAIFVALIFQVIFVFFALLVNVGLLVHHKINLQQSTDLAAYYGAMKQAESLNAMAHVNFQIRQAWKLLTWRYRVLGTFGNEEANGSGPFPILPIKLNGVGGAVIPDLSQPMKGGCLNGANTVDTPFFCVGHAGWRYWTNGDNGCKINCELLNNSFYGVGGVSNQPPLVSGDIANSVYDQIGQANEKLEITCRDLAGANIKVLAQFILGYRSEMMARSQTFNMIAGNLSNEVSQLKDLDGKDVKSGVEKTLKNNLTEANLTGLATTINSYNSLSHPDCALDRTNPAKKTKSKKEFVKRIEFEFINFFQHSCQWTNSGKSSKNGGIQNYNPGSIFNKTLTGMADGSRLEDSNGTPVTVNGNPAYTVKINESATLPTPLQQEILKLISNENEKFSIGYEKNPWCPAYFVVQSSATPRIPFLPLVEIKLHAVSVAKPFGGSIGPWFGKKWEQGDATTQSGLSFNDAQKQTDEVLPANNPSGAPPNLKDNSRLLLNFSRFVGDTKGLSDPVYLAQYHGALINRVPSSGTGLFGANPSADTNTKPRFLNSPRENPSLDGWLKTHDFTDPKYDPIVGGLTGTDSFLRALELTAIAPNQFDITYYSIDADFYNNYLVKLRTNYNILNPSSGNLGPSQSDFIRPDFGYNKTIYSGQPEFSVRNQIEIVKKSFSDNSFSIGIPNDPPKPPTKFIDSFPELVKKQSSLLTGWTFKNFTDFEAFPGNDFLAPEDTMNFGRCKDQWQDSNGQAEYKIPKDISNSLPSTPGNCVTGGRVGYSVKLVSPKSLSVPQLLGGPNSQKDVILNPIPTSFLSNFP